MSCPEHRANISWKRTSPDFSYEKYTRDHSWAFDGGVTVEASASPSYRGNPKLVDPQEAWRAALSSCHMLTFLAIAARKQLKVEAYDDEAIGHLEKNSQGQLAVTPVVLRPKVRFEGATAPSAAELAALHDKAHHECFIANSVLTEVTVEPQ